MQCGISFVVCFQKAQNQVKSQEEKPTSDRVTEKLDEEEKDEDERLLQEIEDELSDLSVPSDKIVEIKEEMQKEFDNIINEVSDQRQYFLLTQRHRMIRPIRLFLCTVARQERCQAAL